MSVKYCLPVPVFYFWRKLQRTLQRGLSAIAEHLVRFNVRNRTQNYDPEIHEGYLVHDTPIPLPHHL